jgi:hypothetical protein
VSTAGRNWPGYHVDSQDHVNPHDQPLSVLAGDQNIQESGPELPPADLCALSTPAKAAVHVLAMVAATTVPGCQWQGWHAGLLQKALGKAGPLSCEQ